MQNAGLNKFGIIIMSGFAALWSLWGLSALGSVPGLLLALPFLVSGAMIALAMRIKLAASAGARRYVGRVVGVATTLEFLAIFAAVNVLSWTGHAGYAVCATAAIVGLHFLPLAYCFGVRSYYWAGAAMTAFAAVACFIPGDATRLLVVGTGVAVLLWVTCLSAFTRGRGVAALAA